MRNTLRVRRAEHGQRGVSQEAVAKAIGMGRDRLHRIECEYGPPPTPDEMQALANYFGCSVAKIFPSMRGSRKATGVGA